MSEPNNLPAVHKESRPELLASGGGPVAIIAHSMEDAYRLGVALVKAKANPRGLDSPEACMIAIMTGAEIGLPPMASIQCIAVINGRASIYGDAVPGVVEAKGAAEYIRESLEGEGENLTAWCETKRKGRPEPVRRSFSVADARRAGLWDDRAMVKKRYYDKQAQKHKISDYETPNDSPWFKYPRRMLQLRARGFCLRDAYPDIMKGLHLAEELQGSEEPEPQTPELPPNPHATDKEEGQTQTQEGGGQTVETETPAQTEESLPALENPEDTAAEWITRLALLADADEIRNYASDVSMWAYLEMSAFSRRTASQIEDAFNRALSRVTPPAEISLPPNPHGADTA